MKKFFTLIAALFCMAAVNAQSETKNVVMTEPNYIQEFLEQYVLTLGVSADGNYVWGSVGADLPAGIYNVKTNDPMRVIEPELENSLGVSIAGITYDGIAFVNENNITYMLNLNDDTRTDLVSPAPEIGMDVWDVTADGKFFAGNITNEDCYYCEPLYGEKQEDGTYKIIRLEYEKMDAMGAVAQFSQARFITEDGKYVMGMQVDSRGMASRLVVWEKQADGTFKISTPLDDIIYDKSIKQPGETPEYEDIVTADQTTDPDLFNEQYDKFSQMYQEYEDTYNKFTRHCALDVFMMHRAKRGDFIYTGIEKAISTQGIEGEFDDVTTYPVTYNCETGKITIHEDLVGHAFEELPGGGFILFDNSSDLYYATSVVTEDGTNKEFLNWLFDMTGTDITQDFSFDIFNPFTGESLTGVFAGLPYFSHDGKTLVLSGADAEFNFRTAVITFDRDIYAALATDIKPNIVNKVYFSANTINIGAGKQGVAEIYNIGGAKCGEYNVDGSLNLSGKVAAGSYIVKVKIDGRNAATLKVIVK